MTIDVTTFIMLLLPSCSWIEPAKEAKVLNVVGLRIGSWRTLRCSRFRLDATYAMPVLTANPHWLARHRSYLSSFAGPVRKERIQSKLPFSAAISSAHKKGMDSHRAGSFWQKPLVSFPWLGCMYTRTSPLHDIRRKTICDCASTIPSTAIHTDGRSAKL